MLFISICGSAHCKSNAGQLRGEAGLVQRMWRGRSIEDTSNTSPKQARNNGDIGQPQADSNRAIGDEPPGKGHSDPEHPQSHLLHPRKIAGKVVRTGGIRARVRCLRREEDVSW